ncbi:hypothetical protein Pcinc_006088 [Petrolisthes cinctipes]|uniref:Reverse transcriptase n=1 Tax=Petrolisthes cinctipes TaxID=88211 RepID=A0AAE1GC37_PETCI|nr:hypothetical protein Pcinc_006088 [Petrolisthes cinctipes]
MELQSRFIPLKGTGQKFIQPKWFNREIRNLLRERRTAYRRAKASGNFDSHRRLNRNVKSKIRAAKHAEEVRVARLCKENPKEFFSYVNGCKPIRRRIGPLVNEDGALMHSDAENANLLNEYFSSVFSEESGPIPEPLDSFSEKLESMVFTKEEIERKIIELKANKSPGPDGFLPRVLKEVHGEVSRHLCMVFNRVIQTGCVPRDWREAEVTPIFKKGDASQPSNYRPISLTSIVCKLMESIMVDKMRGSQHGFQ